MDELPDIRVTVRWMIPKDMVDALEIERQSFEFPWQEQDFVHILRHRNCVAMVADCDGRVTGFMVYETHRDQIYVRNFAVQADCRRQGIGSQMVAKLLNKLSAKRRSRITLEVRETNVSAQLFFKANGFRAVGILHSHFDDTPNEDAYRMEYRYGQEHVIVPAAAAAIAPCPSACDGQSVP
jgi:[ribosomal protein S18]-alanine N-acetyltransferase